MHSTKQLSSKRHQFVAALDVGTTKLKCHLVRHDASIAFSAEAAVELQYPCDGYVEIDPISIWNAACGVISEAVESNGLQYQDIVCMGISCHRCSFLTWNTTTGLPYHRLITWKDKRADALVQSMNSSYFLKVAKAAAKLLYFITRSPKLLSASCLKFDNVQVLCRLIWALENFPIMRNDINKGVVAFGTLDTWLLQKFGVEKHITDYSNVSATALFDPYKLSWLHPMLQVCGIPCSILPTVVNTSGNHFGYTAPSIFGVPIPIRALVADQPASMFGSYCFNEGSVKLTMGTGAFLNLNVGSSPPAFAQGLYPIVAWRVGDSTTYAGECNAPDVGTVIEWAIGAGLCTDVHDCTTKATSVNDCDGVFFIPSSAGQRTQAASLKSSWGFVGIKSTTQVAHMLRALLESIAFIGANLFDTYFDMVEDPVCEIRIDGGVSNNDFIVQKLANVTGCAVVRYNNVERSALGAAFLAGLAEGFWKTTSEIFQCPGKVFNPNIYQVENDRKSYNIWKKKLSNPLAI